MQLETLLRKSDTSNYKAGILWTMPLHGDTQGAWLLSVFIVCEINKEAGQLMCVYYIEIGERDWSDNVGLFDSEVRG